MDDHNLVVGRPDEWARFQQTHPLFVERLHRLFDLARLIFGRQVWAESPEERLVYGLGLLAWEDFEEILNLAGNGFGFGAQKLPRGMFERTVTMAYLFDHPDQADRFIDFEHVRAYKLAREAFDAAGTDALSAERLAELKAESEAVKGTFTRPCKIKGCTTTVDGFSWNDLDIFSMASLAGRSLRKDAWLAYGAALGETHATVQAIKSRMSESGESFTFAEGRCGTSINCDPTLPIAARPASRTANG
jgi:hypothetical protein